MLPNAFTVDVEDYFQVSAFAGRIRREDWPHFESRVVSSTHRLLRLLARHRVRGTFFVLGWVAWRHPELVRDIARDGHEIATHSFWHRLVYEQNPDEFRQDLRRSREVIADASGVCPAAYRAPSFSITQRSAWALDILAEEGITIDSSIFPIRHDRYGIRSLDPAPHWGPLGRERLFEVPPSVVDVGRMRVPVAGGGYFRIFPEAVTRQLHGRLLGRGRSAGRRERPLVFYIHPWEVDPDQPRMPAGRLTRFRHYRNLAKTLPRLERLLERVPFGTLGELVETTDRNVCATEHMQIAGTDRAVCHHRDGSRREPHPRETLAGMEALP